MKKLIITLSFLLASVILFANNGHSLWLDVLNPKPVNIICSKKSATLNIAKQELQLGWQGKADAKVYLEVKHSNEIKNNGFIISENKIQANTHMGILYGVYELLRQQRTGASIHKELCNPSYEHRLLNHWDNLDGSVERGYAGKSIFWNNENSINTITNEDKKLWKEYARANASIGINGVVLNNVNASPLMLSSSILNRTKIIADVFRPYGISVYLSVKFSSPSMMGELKTSDPLNSDVIKWWENRVNKIYQLIPDFGGFLIKANSEGQPGPQDYERTHVDGANMLAEVVKPYGGLIMWRAFVYESSGSDRAMQAYEEFMPFDGEFRDNVIIQVKNGPIDFQPREPFSPLFGAMKKTNVMPELQITQEYLGHSVHMVYLATMWEEFLNFDTFQEGENSTVARCTDGSLLPQKHTAIAGVANIGRDENWCGHLFAQANWYAFGRLSWNYSLTSEQIAKEWIIQTFEESSGIRSSIEAEWKNNFLKPVKTIMLESHEAAVNYMMPLGLHHIFAAHHHYGPGPWWAPKGARVDWTPPYYHQADSLGVGFNRTTLGSMGVCQYSKPLETLFNDPLSCPEMYLLWFHHVSWNNKMRSGRTLWEELSYKYDLGVKQVRNFQIEWDKLARYIDSERFLHVQSKLRKQCMNAQVWKDACLLYFQQFSKMPIPYDVERPIYQLNELEERDMLPKN